MNIYVVTWRAFVVGSEGLSLKELLFEACIVPVNSLRATSNAERTTVEVRKVQSHKNKRIELWLKLNT